MIQYRYAGARTLEELTEIKSNSRGLVPPAIFQSIDEGYHVELSFKRGNIQAFVDISLISDNLFSVTASEADSGWGPLLYDWAIEESTQRDGALCADRRHSVSQDARKVWDYYLHNRSDVKANQINSLTYFKSFSETAYHNLKNILEVYNCEVPNSVWNSYPHLFDSYMSSGRCYEEAVQDLKSLSLNYAEIFENLDNFFNKAGVNYKFTKKPDIINKLYALRIKNQIKFIEL